MTTRLGLLAIIAASLVSVAGCARPDWLEETLVTVDMTGTWQSIEGPALRLMLKQRGTKVTGTLFLQPSASSGGSAIEGTVAGDVFRFSQLTGTPLTGELTVSGDEMSGTVRGPASPTRGDVRPQRVTSSSRQP
jgi:hypothetical protein